MINRSNQPSEWAAGVWKKQVMQGYFDGNKPKMPLTREQVAEVLDRFAEKIREYESSLGMFSKSIESKSIESKSLVLIDLDSDA
ncbi:hypothetical protein [Gracilibacillus xinjiangensis]|uniref:Uncharacterized protein n=1 Tax=Gracilibacillus xinjiangensis TaxID=1193282 RepID=A0ABV8X0P6_9BACI